MGGIQQQSITVAILRKVFEKGGRVYLSRHENNLKAKCKELGVSWEAVKESGMVKPLNDSGKSWERTRFK